MEEETQVNVTAALKRCFCELANTQPGVQMRLAKRFSQLAKSQQTFDSLILWQSDQAAHDHRVNDQRLVQSSS